MTQFMTQARQQSSSGMCRGCGHVDSRTSMNTHQAICGVRLPGGGPDREVFRLRIGGGGPYWLDVDVTLDATLDDLDSFLRAIWLDCCGHLSEFTIGPQVDYQNFDPHSADAASEQSPFRELLTVGETFGYTYDLGSSTELKVRVEARESVFDFGDAVRLLARNLPPVFKCRECGAPAKWVHGWEYDEQTGDALLYCGRHGRGAREEHLPVVNSPRMGVCAYTGGNLDDWPKAAKA